MWVALGLTLACGLIAGQFHSLFGVAPVLGAILCAACFLPSRSLWWVGLGGMLVRDFFVGFDLLTLVRLIGISLVVVGVIQMKIRPTLRSLLTGLFLSAPIFQLALAVGDWLTGTCAIFPKTAHGLMDSLVSSGPYFQRVLVGDILFTSLFLALYVVTAALWVGLKERALDVP